MRRRAFFASLVMSHCDYDHKFRKALSKWVVFTYTYKYIHTNVQYIASIWLQLMCCMWVASMLPAIAVHLWLLLLLLLLYLLHVITHVAICYAQNIFIIFLTVVLHICQMMQCSSTLSHFRSLFHTVINLVCQCIWRRVGVLYLHIICRSIMW